MGRLDLMSYQDADNPIHQTRLKAAASMVQRGELDDDAIFDCLLAGDPPGGWPRRRALGLAPGRGGHPPRDRLGAQEMAAVHQRWCSSTGHSEQAQPEPATHETAPEFRLR